ncbi:unnamed protein product [Cylindrotheca closterium]|uniref:Peptidase S54 rhomboid domain-containing protein n=1 Tax=Cylindrotheca closterium TaxID=2856 RepID=A0AAD2FM25_9STRA|nr:unnamed protein product [Cylindrotheca closterium]
MTVLLERHKWARCILLLTVLPGLFTYVTLTNWIRANECWSLFRHPSTMKSMEEDLATTTTTIDPTITSISSDILHCRSRRIRLPSESNPSIVRLTQSMMNTDDYVYDDIPTNWEQVWLFSAPNKQQQRQEDGTSPSNAAASTTINKYGFRSNKNKNKQEQSQQQQKTSLIPFATYLLGAINIGLYWVYWNYRVDPGRIVHNIEILQDYGRAFTSTFGHFEIWHVGINMMTLFSLGQMLEEQIYGSIPFLMYTVSFVPLTAIVVVLLQRFTTPKSMVGFSGILFAWSVVATLSSSQSCPIMFLPDFCFSTFQLFGAVPISLGPLVQLVVLQVVLPRVSFVGHLSGILVGFVWHWTLLPPLEWLQPTILFPILWSIGKLVLPRFPSWDVIITPVASSNITTSRGGGISGGYTVGGGAAGSEARGVTPLIWIRNALFAHCCILALIVEGVWNSTIMSQVLLILILACIANARKTSNNNGDTSNIYTDWAMMGRGYIIFVAVTLITDAMTVMGWFCLSQSITGLVACGMVLRFVLLYSSLCIMCHMLYVANQTLTGSIWFHACNWLILESCHPIGGWLLSHLERLGSSGTMSSSNSSRGGATTRYSRLVTTPPASPVKLNHEPAQVSNIV